MAKNIVILGAGFGGLRAAKIISKELAKLNLQDKYKLFLIDRNDFHTFTPLLYEAATISREIAPNIELKYAVACPLKEIIGNSKITIINERVMHIDIEDNSVHLTHGQLPFDYLILALGSEINYFNIPGLEKHSLVLKSFEDALKIRDAIEAAIINNAKGLEIIIGGGGSTGVELAAEIKKWLPQVNLTILEATANILLGFDQRVIKKVSRRLQSLGITVKTQHIIKEVNPNRVLLINGESLPYQILIWTGGIKAATLTKQLSLKKESKGRIEVVASLECLPESPDLKVYSRIYAIGDIACIYDPKTGKPVPQVARAAITQGDIAARNIIEEIKKEMGLAKKVVIRTYKPVAYPYIIPVGGKYAVAKIGPFVISGFAAWLLKCLVELNYFISILPPLKALKMLIRAIKIFTWNDAADKRIKR
jgi:NADH dehydrogenase